MRACACASSGEAPACSTRCATRRRGPRRGPRDCRRIGEQGLSLIAEARACSRTATRARSRPPASAPRSRRCTSRRSRAARRRVRRRDPPAAPGQPPHGVGAVARRDPVTVLAEWAGGARMRAGAIDLCIVGADRIAANGDVANKVGTYAAALPRTPRRAVLRRRPDVDTGSLALERGPHSDRPRPVDQLALPCGRSPTAGRGRHSPIRRSM